MMTRTWLLALAGLTLILAACGTGDSDNGEVATLETTTTVADQEPATTTTTIDPEQAAIALTECLREEGLDIEDPTVDADGNVQFGGFAGEVDENGQPDIDDETIRNALTACEDLIADVQLGFEIPDLTELEDTFLEFASCMRDNGYDMPDPDFSGGFFGAAGEDGAPPAGPFGQIDPNDPDFQTAFEACQPILSQLGFPGTGGPGPGGGG